jgi:hypothetical protein
MVSFKPFRRNASNIDVRSPEEKALVRRLDIFLMTFGCISQGAFRWVNPSDSLRSAKLTSVSYQISRSTKYQQCLRIWHEGGFALVRK